MNAATQAWLTKDQLAAQLRDSTALLEAARGEINELAAKLEAARSALRATGQTAELVWKTWHHVPFDNAAMTNAVVALRRDPFHRALQ